MDHLQQIAITDLLAKRERAFVHVWECETAINRILGTDYPFPPPPDLPSRQKRKPRKAARSATTATLRRLCPPENAYRVTYRFDGEQHISYQTAMDLLRDLLRADVPSLEIEAVDTVHYAGPDDVDVIETGITAQR